MKFWKAV